MEGRLYKKLWDIRFKKMLSLEEKAVRDYTSLRKDCEGRLKEHSILPHLDRLIADEKKHAGLVCELMEILERQPA